MYHLYVIPDTPKSPSPGAQTPILCSSSENTAESIPPPILVSTIRSTQESLQTHAPPVTSTTQTPISIFPVPGSNNFTPEIPRILVPFLVSPPTARTEALQQVIYETVLLKMF